MIFKIIKRANIIDFIEKASFKRVYYFSNASSKNDSKV